MRKSATKSLAERLDAAAEMPRATSGSEEVISVSEIQGNVDMIGAARCLAKRGMHILDAKRALEEVAASGDATDLRLPNVVCPDDLVSELAELGVSAAQPNAQRLGL